MRTQEGTPDGEQVVRGETSISRRTLLGAVAFAGTQSISPPGALGASGRWASWRSPSCGASMSYPAGWTVSTRLCPNLMYPRESFALLSGPTPQGYTDNLADLSKYPSNGVLFWLIHYDRVVDPTPFPSTMTLDHLIHRVSEFQHLQRYGGLFSGSDRTFLIRLWIGTRASATTRALISRSLATLAVP